MKAFKVTYAAQFNGKGPKNTVEVRTLHNTIPVFAVDATQAVKYAQAIILTHTHSLTHFAGNATEFIPGPGTY